MCHEDHTSCLPLVPCVLLNLTNMASDASEEIPCTSAGRLEGIHLVVTESNPNPHAESIRGDSRRMVQMWAHNTQGVRHMQMKYSSSFETASSSNSEQPEEPTDSSVAAAFCGARQMIAFQSGSVLTSPASVAAAEPLTVSESQTEKPAHPPRKRLKLGLLKGGASNVIERQ
ncbi:hypothetical protein K438DRAFT_1779677 [Mycena galopus ATCC 62051]|nr:hypothetical protein K438DRAFT_1779677 [Mycena galopus ATCC 62051]